MTSKEKLRRPLEPGQVVILDADLSHSSEVTVVRQTSQKLYTTVYGKPGYAWDVMTYRLTPKE